MRLTKLDYGHARKFIRKNPQAAIRAIRDHLDLVTCGDLTGKQLDLLVDYACRRRGSWIDQDPHLAEIAAGTDVPDEGTQDLIDEGVIKLPKLGLEVAFTVREDR